VKRSPRHADSLPRGRGRRDRRIAAGVVGIIVFALVGCGDATAQPAGESAASAADVAAAPAAAASLTSTRPGEDWPQFLGPRDNGVSGETGLIKSWPKDGPPVLWHRRLGEGYAPVSVRGERLIVQHRVDQQEFVECLHAQSGEPLWKYAYDTDFADPYGYDGGTRCAPVISTTHCYTLGPQGKLLCLALETGEKVWERNTTQEFKVPENFFGAGCTPILDGNRLFVMVGGTPDAAVVAFDAKTGQTLWQSIGMKTWDDLRPEGPEGQRYPWAKEDKLASYSTPIIATIHGQKHLLCLLRMGLVSLNPDDGALRFKYYFRSDDRESVNAARPVVVGDQIFLSAAYNTGAALLKVKPDGKTFDEVWRKPDGLSTHWCTTIHHNGFLYGFSGRHEQESRLQCVELKTGELKWETSGYTGGIEDLGQDPATGRIIEKATRKPIPFPFYGRGSLLLADGKFIALGERGTLALLEPSSEKWKELGRAYYSQIGYPSWSAPILSRGRLYIRSEGHLLCLDLLPR
jgi:outer membrane protein assembly factor BamB